MTTYSGLDGRKCMRKRFCHYTQQKMYFLMSCFCDILFRTLTEYLHALLIAFARQDSVILAYLNSYWFSFLHTKMCGSFFSFFFFHLIFSLLYTTLTTGITSPRKGFDCMERFKATVQKFRVGKKFVIYSCDQS